jgi:hypothetical protein
MANLVGPGSVGRRPEYVENAYELLGTPGQWYFDRPARMLYYVPRPGEDLAGADVEAPVLETLVEGRGTAQAPIHDLAFQGIRFAYATWLFPSTPEGFPEIQANFLVTGPDGYRSQGLGPLYPGGTYPFGNWTPEPGNVDFSFARGVAFENDAFVHLGAAGLRLGDGTQDSVVSRCVFTDISGNGVELGGVDQPEAPDEAVTRGDRISNNRFCNVGAEYHGGIGIVVGYAQRTRIEHNQIDHVPYSGISIGWGGWLDKVKKPGVANNSRGNVIAGNLVFDHMLLLADGAAIYTQGLTGPDVASGEKVLGNVVRDQFGSGHAIYSDNGSCNMTIAQNVIFHTNFDNWGGRHADYYDGHHGEVYDPIVIENNSWQQGDPDGNVRGVVYAGNRLISALEQGPRSVLAAAGLEPNARDILEESFCAPVAPEPPSRVAAWAGNGFALVTWDPPCFEGGSAVRSYTVTASTGQRITLSAADFRSQAFARVNGLAKGECSFTVTANNASGPSVPSLPSDGVTVGPRPIAPPGPPQHVSVRTGQAMVSVHFQAPESDGGSPITSYLVTIYPGEQRVIFSGRTEVVLGLSKRGGGHTIFGVIDGLGAGQTYSLAVAAVNAAGPGAPASRVTVKVAP